MKFSPLTFLLISLTIFIFTLIYQSSTSNSKKRKLIRTNIKKQIYINDNEKEDNEAKQKRLKKQEQEKKSHFHYLNELTKEQDRILESQKDKEILRLKEDTERFINKANNSLINTKYKINISYCLDDKYIYPTLVSMTSLIINANPNSYYNIYIVHGSSFKIKNKQILRKFEKNYYFNCSILFYNIKDKYKNLLQLNVPTAAYYRLELHNLLPNVERLIYVDGDTLIFGDLKELFEYNMDGKYIYGFLDNNVNAVNEYNITDAIVICSGVLLMDLKAIRDNNMSLKMEKFIEKYYLAIEQEDQTIINVVFHGKIGRLPPRYGMFNFLNETQAIEYNKMQRFYSRYNMIEFIYAYHYPIILHFAYYKPFQQNKSLIFDELYWEYAKKTGYYERMINPD